MHLRQATTHLVSGLFKPGIHFTWRDGIELCKTRVESRLLSKEMISPNVSLENRAEGCGIIANNLYIR